MVNPMRLIPYQACRSTEGWFPVKVASSDGETLYTVLVSPWAMQESICDHRCKSYRYRGGCRHQEEAWRRRCNWSELTSPQQQNPDEREYKVCPKCGGATRWEVDVVDE